MSDPSRGLLCGALAALLAMPLAAEEPAASGAATRSEAADTGRWQQRRERYRVLREEAFRAGIELPADPPWIEPPVPPDTAGARAQSWDATADQRMAARERRYAALREEAQALGLELPESPPWRQQQDALAARIEAAQAWWEHQRQIIDAMTPEQRAACQAMASVGQVPRYAPPAGYWSGPGASAEPPYPVVSDDAGWSPPPGPGWNY